MKRKEYIKPAARVRQLYTNGSVMEDFAFSPGTEMDDVDTFAKEHNFIDDDFEYPEGKSVWED